MSAMDNGLLSLRWNDHAHTFFSMLSSVRKKEMYCDATLACEGLFYPVHKLVLSTCSDFFNEMFERTSCKHPVIVVASVAHKDLEALLNYMYLGEVNIFHNELTGLMNAAESLRIKGLAEPSKGAPARDTGQGKRSTSGQDVPDGKRRKSEGTATAPECQSSSSQGAAVPNTRHLENSRAVTSSSQVPGVQDVSSCDHSRTSTKKPSSSCSESSSLPHKQDSGVLAEAEADQQLIDKTGSPEVKMEELAVKEEPESWFCDAGENNDGLEYSEADASLCYGDGHQGKYLTWELPAPHALEAHLPPPLPGPSGMQGVGDMMKVNYRRCTRWTDDQRRQIYQACCMMGPAKAARELSQKFGRNLNESTVRSIQKSFLCQQKL